MLSDDVLPQPYRFLNKLVNRCIDDAFESIRRRDLAEQSHRKFAPPRTMRPLRVDDCPLLVTASDQPIPGGPLKAAEPTATYSGPTSTLFGFKQGRVVVHAAGTGDVLGAITIKHGEPIVALAGAAKHCVFAAATDTSVTIFYALNEEAAAARRKAETQAAAQTPAGAGAASEAHGTPLAGGVAQLPTASDNPADPAATLGSSSEPLPPPTHTLAVWVTIDGTTVPQLNAATINDLTISDDASFLAVTVGSGAEVVVVRLPDSTNAKKGSAPAADDDADASTAESPSLAFIARPPAHAEVQRNATVRVTPVIAFVCDDAAVAVHGEHALGGHRRPGRALPLAWQLCIAWCGTNVFSTFALRQLPTLYGPAPPVLPASEGANKAQQQAGDVAVVATQASSGKGQKGPKADAAPAAGGASAAGATADRGGAASPSAGPTPVVPVPNTFTPGVPFLTVDAMHSGERHRFTPHIICTASLCRATPRGDLFAIGCFDGIIWIWSALRGCVLWHLCDAPLRAVQKSVNPLIVTNIEFHRGTHVIAGLALPIGSVTPTSTNHSRVVVYSILTGERVCSVDFVPQLSWVATARALPIFVFATAGAVYAADIYTGAVMAPLEIPALAATCPLPKTADLNLLLEYCWNVRKHAAVDLGQCISLAATSKNESGEPRRRAFLLDCAHVIFTAYPVIEQFAHRFNNDQLTYLLSKVTDPADRHKSSVITSVAPPGAIGNVGGSSVSGDLRKSIGGVSAHGRASSVATVTTLRAAETPASTTKPPVGTRRTETANSTTKPGGKQLADAAGVSTTFVLSATSTPAAPITSVQRLLDQRDAGKAQREQRFKALWAAMQP